MGPQDHCFEGSKIDEIEVKKEKRFEGRCAIFLVNLSIFQLCKTGFKL